jgi:hypothetical protein
VAHLCGCKSIGDQAFPVAFARHCSISILKTWLNSLCPLWHRGAARSGVLRDQDSLEWPAMVAGSRKVEELTPGDANGIGSVRRYLWKSRLPYRLSFDIRVTRMQPLKMVEA